MSKRKLDGSDASGSAECSDSKNARISANENDSLRKYLELLQQTSEKFRNQNSSTHKNDPPSIN